MKMTKTKGWNNNNEKKKAHRWWCFGFNIFALDLFFCLITDHLLRYTFGVLITWSSINNGFHDEYTQNCTFWRRKNWIKAKTTAFKNFIYILSSYCGFCFRCATNIPPVDIEYWTMEMKRNHLLTTQIVLLCTFPLFAFVGCVTRISTVSTFLFFIH